MNIIVFFKKIWFFVIIFTVYFFDESEYNFFNNSSIPLFDKTSYICISDITYSS